MRTSAHRLTWVMLFALAATAFAAPARAQGLSERFTEACPGLTRQLKSRRVPERISAIETLSHFPLADSARLLHGCFIDKEESVRSAAYDALMEMNEQQEVCDELISLADESLRSRADREMVLPAIAILLGSELPLAQTRAQCFLDHRLSESPQSAELLVALADNLGAHGKASDVRPLLRLSKSRVFAKHFGVRRAVVQALTRTPPADSLDPLIDLMDIVGGEAKADAASYLTQVTGQKFGLNIDAWRKWRAAQAPAGSEAAMPPTTPPPITATVSLTKVSEGTFKRVEEVASEGGHYYGIPLFADRLVFVLDTSGSMQGGRMMAAKREMIHAIENMRSQVEFGIVVFNSSVGCWHKDLVPADMKNKKAAIAFIERQNPQASTSSYNALEAALGYDVEAIYFLSDGAPTSGKLLAPVDIVREVSGSNHVRRISIYTIGIAPGYSGSPTDQFLKTLAEENLGTYRRIDG